ncbi:MAG: peptidase S9 family protein [Sphingomonas sp. 28-66-16]|nr:MAG: peptidase S9 family protein [Sphingomonas sp. 28-66-16]
MLAVTPLLLLSAAPAPVPGVGTPTVQESLDVQSFNNPAISPDGRWVVYEESRTNWVSNAFETDLWIADSATGDRRLLTVQANSSNAAAWSRDGRWIAFLSDRPGVIAKSPSGKRQLWVMPAGGGEAQQVTALEDGVSAFEWAPDSRHFGIVTDSTEPGTLKQRKESFGDYHIVRGDYVMAQLWLIALPQTDAAGRAIAVPASRPITNGKDFSVMAFDFAPDGSKIAFASVRDPDIISGVTSKIQVADLATGKISMVAGEGGPNGNPKWSPDGRAIAFETAAGAENYYYANGHIGIVPASGGATRIVGGNFDEDAQLLGWDAGGIAFAALQKTEAGLFRIDPGTGAVTRVALAGTPIARSFSLSRSGRRLAYVGAAANRFPEIYLADLDRGAPAPITRGGEQLAQYQISTRQVVSWKSSDGTPIEGILYTPKNFDPKKKYPLLVVIHGGPTGIDLPVVVADRYYPIERFIARGAIVLRPNYRGSAGYGAAFRALNVRNLGVGDYQDVISGVDSLVAKGFVDPARVGAMGWSQGGYISAFIATASDRFKAVSVGAGISDWMTYYANTDITPFTVQYLKATPWDDPEVYRKTSPIAYLATARTPTLIQHGGSDRRVPIANGYELRQALEDKGVPVKMVVYEGLGHPINKPKQQRAVLEENENWFGHYIFGAPLADDLVPDKPATGDARCPATPTPVSAKPC